MRADMPGLRTLSNRIFAASALLAVSCVVAAVWLINRTVTAQAERGIERGLAESATLVTEYRRLTTLQLAQAAQLLADLPKLKAAVALDDPPTLAPLAGDYRRQLGADVLVMTNREGTLLAQDGLAPADGPLLPSAPGTPWAVGRARASFLPREDGLLLLVTVPIWIDPGAPDLLGTLSVGRVMDAAFAAQVRSFTDSDVTFVWGGQVRATTLPAGVATALAVTRDEGAPAVVSVGDEEFGVVHRPLDGELGEAAVVERWPGQHDASGAVLVARSRSEQLRPLRALHTALAVIGLVAVLAATLLSYLVSRSITRPLRALTATMRDLAASGDIAAPPPLAAVGRWDDEDARVLASTFNTMTASLARFQREAALRERLSTLGRLSTVVAHEIRNPLMIIRAALRNLRRSAPSPDDARAAVADIDEEVTRLDRLVDQVLDFARPIRFDLAPARLSEICRDAARAVEADGLAITCEVRLDPAADAVVTDAERLRQALVNVLSNARQAVAACNAPERSRTVILETSALDGQSVAVAVRDNGPGIDQATLARIFEPFFSTKPTGTGIGLAITRNIVEGLGGTMRATSTVNVGTEIAFTLPRTGPPAGHSLP